MSSPTEEKKPTESNSIMSGITSVTDSLGITDSKKEEKKEESQEEVPIVNVVKPDEPESSSKPAETEESKPAETEESKPTETEEPKPIVEATPMQEKEEKPKKKKKNTKKMLFKNKRIQSLLKKMKTSKKTEDQLLIELDDIINKKIDMEIKKHNEMIKSLREQKTMLMHKIKKEFTKKSGMYPEMSIHHKKTRKAKKIQPVEPMREFSRESSQQIM